MKYILYFILSLISIFHISAATKSDEILSDMSSAIDKLGGYEVRFKLESGGQVMLSGEYVVDGDIYKLSVAQQEIYGDDTFRITIDHSLKEVVMESVEDSAANMIISNPAKAFSSLDKSFDSRIIDSTNDNEISMSLTPRKSSDLFDSVVIDIDTYTTLPVLARYISGGEVVTVRILEFNASDTKLLPLNDISMPDGYDVIDVR